MKTAIHKQRIDAENYVNLETGQSLADEMTTKTRLNKEVLTDQKIIEFDDFVASDTAIELDMIWSLPPADYRRYRLMANFLHTNFNIVMNGNNCPHTPDTLSKLIRLKKDETTRFIKRLTEKGLIFYGIIPGSKYEKVYAMNPNVIKKRTKVDEQLLKLFPKFKNGKRSTSASNTKSPKKLSSLQPEQAN